MNSTHSAAGVPAPQIGLRTRVLRTEHLFSFCQATTHTPKHNRNDKHPQLRCLLICSEPKTNSILQSQTKDASSESSPAESESD